MEWAMLIKRGEKLHIMFMMHEPVDVRLGRKRQQ